MFNKKIYLLKLEKNYCFHQIYYFLYVYDYFLQIDTDCVLLLIHYVYIIIFIINNQLMEIILLR